MRSPPSLRLRLTAIILVPLLAIALAVGAWQVRDARDTAAGIFDRSLLTVALAVSGDVARSGGNALTVQTRDLLEDTSGGPVYYHVYAPNGYYVTGYATPPPRQTPEAATDLPYGYYNSTYHGQQVRALRLRTLTTIEGITGVFTVTVWQVVGVRDALMRSLATRAFVVMAVLIGTVALVVWFGVRHGLRPLTDLEDAIALRSPDDLSPIRRPVPPETRGLVLRLNLLFAQLEGSISRQASFISNAAHQLRNPIAGVLALAEAVQSAPTHAAARARSADLLASARHVRDLANKLLALERASAAGGQRVMLELGAMLEDVTRAAAPAARAGRVRVHLALPEDEIMLCADPVMLREALGNLIDNALRHGGPQLRHIHVALALTAPQDAATDSAIDGAMAEIVIGDDGRGLPVALRETALARFGQAVPGEGSGLGLSIARAVAVALGGDLRLGSTAEGGLEVRLRLPCGAPCAPPRAAPFDTAPDTAPAANAPDTAPRPEAPEGHAQP